MAAVWAACSLYQHTRIWIESSFASPVGKETAAISTKQQLTILRYHWQSTDTPPTVDRYTSDISAEMSAECRPTYRPIVSTDGLLTRTTCRPILGRHVGRHIGRLSVDISVESIDRYSVDRCLKYTWSLFSFPSARVMNAFCNEAVAICCENVAYLRGKKFPCISQGMKKHSLLINLSKFSKIIRHYVFFFSELCELCAQSQIMRLSFRA